MLLTLPWERAVIITEAPAANTRLALSRPRPVFAPVMSTVLPVKRTDTLIRNDKEKSRQRCQDY
jgi:hypothetical protein